MAVKEEIQASAAQWQSAEWNLTQRLNLMFAVN